MTFWLLQTMNDIDPDLVERAAQRPRKVYPLRWVAAVAAAAVMVVGVGVWWQHRPEDKPPIDGPVDPTVSTTTDGGAVPSTTTQTTQITTTTTESLGIGGDEESCDGCSPWYHNFDGELIDYIGSERFHAWIDAQPTLPPDKTYPYNDCRYPGSNIIACVEYFGVTREQFIEAMGWEDLLDHMFVDSIVQLDDPSPYLYTFGDFVEAIYGDDPHLTAWVFSANVSDRGNYSVEWTHQYYYAPPHDVIYPDPIYTYEGSYSYKQYCSLAGVNANIVDYVRFAGVTREQFIDIYGWADKLDEKATDHFAYAPYTYRQFVDAIYGDDEALRDWVFNCYVFHPDYPEAP